MKSLTVLLCFVALPLFALSLGRPPKLTRMSVEDAKRALADPKHSDYTSAIDSILESKIKEGEKTGLLFSFFVDTEKMERLQTQLNGNTSQVYALRLCADKLAFPSAFILRLYVHKVYGAGTKEARHRQDGLLVVAGSLKKPSSELLNKIVAMKSKDDISGNRFHIIAKHADDATLKKALAFSRKGSGGEQGYGISMSMLQSRHRPAVFEYCVESYLRHNYSKNLLNMIILDKYNFEKSSTYDRVAVKDAPLFLKQIDRILAIRGELGKLTSKYDRVSDLEVEKLLEIRRRMQVYKDVTAVRDAKDLKPSQFSLFAKYAKAADLKRVLDLSREMAKAHQVEDIPVAMRESRHRPLVFTYYVDSLLKFRSAESLRMIVGQTYSYRNQSLKMGSYYATTKGADAAVFVKQIGRILKDKSSLREAGLDDDALRRLNVLLEVMKTIQADRQ